MARKGTQQSEDFCLFDSPPMDIVELTEFDNSDLYLNSVVPLTLYLFLNSFYVTILSTKKKDSISTYVRYFILL